MVASLYALSVAFDPDREQKEEKEKMDAEKMSKKPRLQESLAQLQEVQELVLRNQFTPHLLELQRRERRRVQLFGEEEEAEIVPLPPPGKVSANRLLQTYARKSQLQGIPVDAKVYPQESGGNLTCAIM
jgi:hypothetical protein